MRATEPKLSSKALSKKLLATFTALVLLATACGADTTVSTDAAASSTSASAPAAATDVLSDAPEELAAVELDTPEPIDATEAPADPAPAVADPDAPQSLCDAVTDMVQLDPFADLDIINGDLQTAYAEVTERWTGIVEAAPSEIQDDLSTILSELENMGSVAESYDFNLMDPGFLDEAMAIDPTPVDEAAARLGSYLEENCVIITAAENPPMSIDDVTELTEVPEDPAGVLVGLFGIDQETAECIVDEFGLEPGQGMADFDMTRLNEEMCGTTMMQVVSGG